MTYSSSRARLCRLVNTLGCTKSLKILDTEAMYGFQRYIVLNYLVGNLIKSVDYGTQNLNYVCLNRLKNGLSENNILFINNFDLLPIIQYFAYFDSYLLAFGANIFFSILMFDLDAEI